MNPSSINYEHLCAALALEAFDGRGAQGPMEPLHRGAPRPGVRSEAPRDAAALAFVFERGGRLHLPLTLRHADLREHRGQVALPGGRPDTGESLRQTAWREAQEEIGLVETGAQDLGVLTPVYIPVSHTRLHVHVAHGPDPGALRANPGEVEQVEVVAVADLLDPARRARRDLAIGERVVDVPYFDVGGLFVWGATAMALSELAERLRVVVGA